MDKDKAATAPLTNTQRLRAHLTSGGLADVLLHAWEADELKAVHERLLEALNKFHNPEKTGNGQGTAE
jgi:hypothetical protein